MDAKLFRLCFGSFTCIFCRPYLKNWRVTCQDGCRIKRPFSYMKSPCPYTYRETKKHTRPCHHFYSTDKQLILDRHNEKACYKLYGIFHQYSFDIVKYRLQNSVILNVSYNFPKRCTLLKINFERYLSTFFYIVRHNYQIMQCNF